jgi:hypothetical protein
LKSPQPNPQFPFSYHQTSPIWLTGKRFSVKNVHPVMAMMGWEVGRLQAISLKIINRLRLAIQNLPARRYQANGTELLP